MKLADLPANVQRQIRAGGARAPDVRPAAQRSRPTAASAGRTPSHRCETCGHAGTYPNVEAHVDGHHGHGRIALVLDVEARQ